MPHPRSSPLLGEMDCKYYYANFEIKCLGQREWRTRTRYIGTLYSVTIASRLLTNSSARACVVSCCVVVNVTCWGGVVVVVMVTVPGWGCCDETKVALQPLSRHPCPPCPRLVLLHLTLPPTCLLPTQPTYRTWGGAITPDKYWAGVCCVCDVRVLNKY